jgi:mannose-1-phosphate guanylyltransferase
MSIKAIILAAGKGTRVQPLTYDLPKPMIPILGKPVMEYLIEHLARQGVRDIMVNVSHLSHRIEQYFGDGRRYGVRLGYSFEGYLEGDEVVASPVGSAGALRKIQDFGGFIDDTTVVLCGDAIIDLDIQAAVAAHRAQRALASVITRPVRREEVSSYGVVVSDPNGRVTSFQEKPTPQEALSNDVSTGIYIFEPAAIALIPREQVYDIGSQFFPQLVASQLPFYSQSRDFEWIDIGKVSDYWEVIQRLMAQPSPSITIPGVEVRPQVWAGQNVSVPWDQVSITGPVYIGSGTRIEPGCVLQGPLWIDHGCHIQAGARVARSVLFEYARVRAGAELDAVIVSGHYGVTRSGDALPGAELCQVLPWSDARCRLSPAHQQPQFSRVA